MPDLRNDDYCSEILQENRAGAYQDDVLLCLWKGKRLCTDRQRKGKVTMETCINYCEPGCAYISSDERRWINHIRKLALHNPDDVIILKQPEQNEGFIYAKFPQKWVKVRAPKQVGLTEEQRIAAAERLAAVRQNRKNNK